MKFFDVGYAYTPLGESSPTRRWKKPRILPCQCALYVPYILVVFLIASLVANIKLHRNIGKVQAQAQQECHDQPPPRNALDDLDVLNAIDPVNTADMSFLRDTITTNVPSRDERAIVSSLYSDAYLPGVLTLAQSLTAVHTSARLLLFYFPERISRWSACLAREAGWELIPVERIPPPDDRELFYRYADQYTKLRIWTLDSIGIKMGVYIDGDTVVARNLDELFSLPYNFAAVPDIYNPAGFTLDINAGVLVFRPSSDVFEDMMSKLKHAKFDLWAAEQGFLRMYFAHQVVRLPLMYNANLAIKVRNLDTWSAVMGELRILHFTLVKPFPEDRRPSSAAESEAAVRANLADRKSTYENGMWKSEMELWERHYNDSVRHLAGKCLL